MIHMPHGWVILKFTNEYDVFFKIFASWRGGYLDGDSWRLSSGSYERPRLSDCSKYWIWQQTSGSCYKLAIHGENQYSSFTEIALCEILYASNEKSIIKRISMAELLDSFSNSIKPERGVN
ncbi:hypothetical protein [Pseudoalteromonas sp. MMG024]|uniref:hypothetical protein n=1 Tax=Pseudoalteromonas sp. MMG024 TaxID=2909980 RepID=UPI001F321471|nr:hypothetical protein [Pseudoalteromonas sp. MMG024]MCF6458985.1 hypothetical protein [Pseudoalteromonas sp. MMG024]